MPRMELEPTVAEFDRAKTVHALDRRKNYLDEKSPKM
jgi:hypothetical protein